MNRTPYQDYLRAKAREAWLERGAKIITVALMAFCFFGVTYGAWFGK